MKNQRRVISLDDMRGWKLCLDCGTWVKPTSANCYCDVPANLRLVVKAAQGAVDTFDDGGDEHDLSNRVSDIKMALEGVS